MPTDVQLQQKTNGMLWALLGLVVTFALGYFYVLPQVSTLRETRLATEALAADVTGLQAAMSEVQALDQSVAQRSAIVDQLNLAVPSSAAVDELIVSLETIASSAGVVLPTVQPATSTDGSVVPLTVTVRGSYSGVRLFLELLEQNLRPIRVTTLTMSTTSDVSGASLVTTTLTLEAARVPTATAAKADEAPNAAAAPGGANED